MKVAIVHDYIKEYGGAERVLEALHEVWPDAPVYTSVYLPEYLGPHADRFKNWNIKTSWFQSIPFKEKLISPLRLLAPFAFGQFDFSGFDVVIVSATGAYMPNMIQVKSQKSKIKNQKENFDHGLTTIDSRPIHICYCHTPPRYLYGYATAREWKKNPVIRVLAETANHFLRMLDFTSSQHVDFFIANSKNVAGRIEKFYRKDATVIYPPVDVDGSKYHVVSSKGKEEKNISHNTKYILPNTGYYLAGGRLARPKHIDLIVKTCTKYKLPLMIFGKEFAGYGEELEKLAGPTVTFVGEVTDEEKWELMQNAKAYIFAAEDEDFGITPVEAMAAGTPVIAYRSGGVVESVVEGRTGIFFDELSVAALEKAIQQLEKAGIRSEDCKKQAEKFSEERFKTEIKHFVLQVVKQ